LQRQLLSWVPELCVLQHIQQITGFDGGHHGLETKATIGQELGIFLVAPQK
jgi:hypothetical protein